MPSHLALQAALGWSNSHLYEIRARGVGWGIPDDVRADGCAAGLRKQPRWLKFARLSAGGRWIRTSSTRARSIWLSALLGELCFAIGCGPGEALLVQRGISDGAGRS